MADGTNARESVADGATVRMGTEPQSFQFVAKDESECLISFTPWVEDGFFSPAMVPFPHGVREQESGRETK